MVADDASLADDHTRAMVYREIFAYLRTWMDVDARVGVGLFGDDAG